MDLDVLDPGDFPDTPVPVPGGMREEALLSVLEEVRCRTTLVGLGIYEYQPSGKKNNLLNKIIEFGKSI